MCTHETQIRTQRGYRRTSDRNKGTGEETIKETEDDDLSDGGDGYPAEGNYAAEEDEGSADVEGSRDCRKIQSQYCFV